MRKILFVPFSLMLLVMLSSCDDGNDKVKDISKDGAIETVMSVEHFSDKLDVIKTTHKVWVKNVMVNSYMHTDTIPSLGTTKEKAENSDGDMKEIDLKKDYEFYITVK